MVNWSDLQQVIGVTFRDPSILQQVFIHSSYINENPGFPLLDNERLEFLGDALLSSIVAEKLYHEFPHLAEGELTKIRTSLIRQETLAQLGLALRLGDYLHLGKGEEATGGRQRQTNLADTFEALIGAIFLDQGLTAARDFVLSKLDSQLEEIKTKGISPDYKALLQEFTQAKYKQLPTYHLVEASGPDHDRNFTIEVALGDRILGAGSGKSRRAAEMEAARSAWEKLATD
ncbi:MAG TPA: ribonuclease III [Dehalococcoidia bacterium]|nr:ribonuclease III [Dehalococcoidia bacterium]